MEKAKFTLDTFQFDRVEIDLSKRTGDGLNIKLEPRGEFSEEDKLFTLFFEFRAYNNTEEIPFVKIHCVSDFKFENLEKAEDIPSYFYSNSIAIIFPYIRAFISSVTLQANINPLVLPTFNLVSLSEPLKNNTTFN